MGPVPLELGQRVHQFGRHALQDVHRAVKVLQAAKKKKRSNQRLALREQARFSLPSGQYAPHSCKLDIQPCT